MYIVLTIYFYSPGCQLSKCAGWTNFYHFLKQTRKSCSETNTKAALRYCQWAISNLIEISKFYQGLFYITALALMPHFRDNIEKKLLKITVSWPFWILFLQNFSCVILVWVLTFCSICMVQEFCSDFELRKYHKYLLETFSWNVLTSISLLVALVINGLIIWQSKCHQKFPGGIWWLCEVWGSRSS